MEELCYIRKSKANEGFGKKCMVMYFFFNDTTTEMLTETKGSNREIEAPFEDETDEMMKDIFMDLRKKLDEVKARCDTYRRERDEARTLAARRLKRCRELEERNARLEADHERHKDSLVCLTDRLADLERENARLRGAIGHFYGECAELVQGASTPTAPTVVAQHNYYPGSLHVSGSHLPDAHFNPAPTGHELTRK